MRRRLTTFFICLLLGASMGANAGPAENRKALIEYYKQKLPDIKFENYNMGALAMNPDAMNQYNSIMEFPPFSIDMDEGRAKWETPFKNGKHFADCFPGSGKNVAGNYPYFDDTSGKVVTFENAVNACLKTNGEAELKYDSRGIGLLTAYARSLSDGMPVNVKVSGPGAVAAYEKGQQFYYGRRGQLNFSCSICHIDNVGKFIRSEQLSMMIGQAAHWPEFRAGTELLTLQGRFRQCNKNTRSVPLDFNSEEYNDLEYFLTYMSNGQKMLTPVFRK